MLILLSLLITASAVLHIRAEYTGQRRQIYLFKPLTTTLIILLTPPTKVIVTCPPIFGTINK